MDPIFENRYVADFSTLAEFARKYRIGPRPVIGIVCVLVYIAMTIFSVVQGIWQDMLPLLIGVGFLYIFGAVLPWLYARSSLKGMKRQNDGVLPETVVTFGDTIQLFEGMIHITVEYQKVIRVVRLKHSYCLMTSRTTGVIIHENAFTKGNFKAFKEFLRKKYPNLTIPE